MRNAATHSGKDLAKEIALLREQLDELAKVADGAGSTLVARGGEALDETLRSARELIARYGDTARSMAHDASRLKERASGKLIEQTEAHPFTTLAAIVGIGFLAGWLFRRR